MDSRALQPGEQIDRYLIEREAARGGMGTIYQARDTVLGRVVALKMLPSEFDQHREYRERFVREARAAAKIHHRNVVAVHDVSVRAPLYIVMEFLRGETLDSFLKREAPVSFERALDLLLPVMSAVSAAHDSRVIHRDLKPANIMLAQERDGTVIPKVLDFGISKVTRPTGSSAPDIDVSASTDVDLTGHDQQLGTPSYMAPEQADDQSAVGPWSDGYALALLLYLALTGRRAFVGRSAAEVLVAKRAGAFQAPSEFPFGLPRGLDAWMVRALAPDTARRFASVREMTLSLLTMAADPVRSRWEPLFTPDDAHVDGSVSSHPSAPVGNLDVTASEGVVLDEPKPAPAREVKPELPAPRSSRRERGLALAVLLMGAAVVVLGARELRRPDPAPDAPPPLAPRLRPAPIEAHAPPPAPPREPIRPPPTPTPVVDEATPAVAAPDPTKLVRAQRPPAPVRSARCPAGRVLVDGVCREVPSVVIVP